MFPLLLTGTIQVQGQNNHKVLVTKERLHQYMTNIIRYIVDSPFTRIIFCENSAYPLTALRADIERIASFYEKQIELLQFQGDSEKSSVFGRGYGEAEIIEYAIDHSSFLTPALPFIKITGRYYLTNSYAFVSENTKNVMFSRMSPFEKRCSTACFIVTPEFYRSYLWGAGAQVNDAVGRSGQLEGVFTRLLHPYRKQIPAFRCLPIFQAMTGSGYVLKPNRVKDTCKQCMNHLGRFKL